MKLLAKLFMLIGLLYSTNKLFAQTDTVYIPSDSLKYAFHSHKQRTPIYVRQQYEVDEKELFRIIDAAPSFAVFKDVYFVTGIPLNTSINSKTADAMFQISFRQRLTKSHLPFNTFLYLTYTQKSFWDIYSSSSPFRDNNYNPGIGLGRYIIKDRKLLGGAFLGIEHESNGRDSIASRSWNLISFSAKYFFNLRLKLGVKLWIPFMISDLNRDIVDYRGLGSITANYTSINNRWWVSAEVTPRKGWGNVNTNVGIGYRVSKASNQYLFLRFFNGTGDSQLDYTKYNLNIRFGICIKPDFYSVY